MPLLAYAQGYGFTSSTVLVMAGLPPRTASEVVHLAQLGTTLVSGLAHLRARTVHWPTAWRMALPGTIGALVGASLLAWLPAALAKALASCLLLGAGMYLFVRFYSPRQQAVDPTARLSVHRSRPSVCLRCFIDVAGGGGWGPVATSGLLAEGRLLPANVIGTVSLSGGEIDHHLQGPITVTFDID